MPDLLLELFSEEIPARMQAKAADDLRKMVTDKLVAEGLVYEGAKAFVTPRRLALTVHGIPARQPDLKQERKGPKMGAPDAAVQGFLKATGLKSLDEAKIQRDPKGDFYIALIEKPGRPAIDVIAEIIPLIIRQLFIAFSFATEGHAATIATPCPCNSEGSANPHDFATTSCHTFIYTTPPESASSPTTRGMYT